jgi:capsular exopolysaccharide synthesis family protein
MRGERNAEGRLPEVFRGRDLPALRQETPALPWEGEDSASFERYLQVLLRRKWLLVAVLMTTLAGAAVYVFTRTPLYQASATLQIDPDRQSVVPYQGFEPAGASSWEYLETQIHRIQSRTFFERVENRFGQPLDGSLRASQVGSTLLVAVSFTAADPAVAAEVANLAAEEFVRQDLERRVDAAQRASKFLEQQLTTMQSEVQHSEESLLRYARDKSIVDLGDRESVARQRLDELNAEVTRVEGELFALKSHTDLMAATHEEVLPDELQTEQLRLVEDRIGAVDRELAALSERFGPEWPEIKKLQQEREYLLERRVEERASILADARKDYQVKQSVHGQLVAELGQQRALVDRFNENLIQFDILQRESSLNKELYEGLLQRLREGGIAASLESSDLQVVEAAEVPRFPVSPNKTKALVQALALGLALGLVAVVVAELLDNSIKSTEDVNRLLGLPALGVVPALEAGAPSRRRTRWRRREAERVGPALAFDSSRTHATPEEEAYRSVRTALLLSHSGTPPQVILVTSSFPREGKSTTAVNVAISLAQTGARTLIIDLDLRKSSVGGVFGLEASPGMSAYLSGNSDLSSQIRESGFPNLFLAPAGPPPPNPAELIGSAQMDTALRLLRDYFAYIVIDSPPCVGLSDAVLLARRVDGVLLVARAGQTPKRALLKAAEVLHRVGATFLGVLVNDARLEQRAYGYYGQYTYGYGTYFTDERAGGRKTA